MGGGGGSEVSIGSSASVSRQKGSLHGRGARGIITRPGCEANLCPTNPRVIAAGAAAAAALLPPQRAVADGVIAPSRYASYAHMLLEMSSPAHAASSAGGRPRAEREEDPDG